MRAPLRLLRTEASPRLLAVVAALAVGAAIAVVHELALRGWQKWAKGGSDLEAQLTRPELLALDLSLHAVDLWQHARHTGPSFAVSDPQVQVVALTTEPGLDESAELAAVMVALDEMGARAVLVDLPQPLDRLLGARATLAAQDPSLAAWAMKPEADLAAAMGHTPCVLTFRTFLLTRGPARASSGIAQEAWLSLRGFSSASLDGAPAVPVSIAAVPPAPLLAVAHPAARHDLHDADGITRREPMVVATRDEGSSFAFPGAALETARLALGLAPGDVSIAGTTLHLGARTVPVTTDGFLLVDHRRRAKVWPAREVIAKLRPASFQGAAVVVALPAIYDAVVFPLGDSTEPQISHGEHEASAILDLFAGRGLVRPALWDPSPRSLFAPGLGALSTLALALLGAALVLLLPGRTRFLHGEKGALRGAAIALVAPAALWIALSVLLLARGLWIDAFYPALGAASGAVAAASVEFLAGGVERRTMRRMIDKMLPEAVAGRALRDPRILALGGTQRELTVLFADLRGFTRFSESHPPEKVVEVLRAYQTAMVRTIRSNQGTIDKLMGDGTMAFFGAPQDDPEHALHAVWAAIGMLEALEVLNARWQASGEPPLAMGIGIHTGRVVLGNMGTPDLIAYTVIGDAVNVASRLEAMTKDVGSPILLGESTAQGLGDRFALKDVGPLQVRGRTGSIRVFEVLPESRQGGASRSAK